MASRARRCFASREHDAEVFPPHATAPYHEYLEVVELLQYSTFRSQHDLK